MERGAPLSMPGELKGCCLKQMLRWLTNCDDCASFFLCSRLYVLQGGLAQQEWRVPELLHRLLQYLEPKLTQVYKNVRERIGRWGPFFYPHSEHECTISHYKLLCIFFCVSCSDLLSFQRAHIHLHDWCQPAIHSADHLPAHLWLHRPNTAAAEASNRGWWGDPESRDWGERGGSAGREDASHQATQNRWVKGLSSKHKRHNELLFFVGMV